MHGELGGMDKQENTSISPPVADAAPPATLRERVVDLLALLALLTGACAVFAVAGAEAFAVVTSVGMGLFSTWRARR